MRRALVIALAIAGCDAGGRTAVPVAAPWNATPRSVVDTEALFGALGALEEAERLGDPARARAVLADEVVLVACGRVRSWRRDDRGALAALTAATRLAEPGVKAWDATLATDSGMAWVTSVAGAAAAPVRRLDVLVRRGDGWALVAEALVPDPSTRDAVCAGLAAIAGGAPAIDRSAAAVPLDAGATVLDCGPLARLGADEQGRLAAATGWPPFDGAMAWTVGEQELETSHGTVRLASLAVAERAGARWQTTALASTPDDATYPALCSLRDTDQDGFLDEQDECPDQPETFNGYHDEDGCPDKGRVIVHDTAIEVLDKVYFATDSDAIRPESLPLLDAVAATMLGNPDIQLVELQGHADDHETDPVRLSGRRGLAVRDYLVDKGIELRRFEVAGYGAAMPSDPADTAEARARNRRVEFLILRRTGT